MAPQLVDAKTDGGDFVFLDMTRSAFDLSDRGVEGRPAPRPLDVFLDGARHLPRRRDHALTALARDRARQRRREPAADPHRRPPGRRRGSCAIVTDGGRGGYAADLALDGNAMRGTWPVADLSPTRRAPPLAQIFLVEDFVPDRIEFDLSPTAKEIAPGEPPTSTSTASYLYGAPAAGLASKARSTLSSRRRRSPASPAIASAWPTRASRRSRNPLDLDAAGRRGRQGDLPGLAVASCRRRPGLFEATAHGAHARNRRPRRRALARPAGRPSDGMMIGIRPEFAGDEVPEGGTAELQGDRRRRRTASATPRQGLTWKLERLERRLPVVPLQQLLELRADHRHAAVANGTIDTTADGAATIAAGRLGPLPARDRDADADRPSDQLRIRRRLVCRQCDLGDAGRARGRASTRRPTSARRPSSSIDRALPAGAGHGRSTTG